MGVERFGVGVERDGEVGTGAAGGERELGRATERGLGLAGVLGDGLEQCGGEIGECGVGLDAGGVGLHDAGRVGQPGDAGGELEASRVGVDGLAGAAGTDGRADLGVGLAGGVEVDRPGEVVDPDRAEPVRPGGGVGVGDAQVVEHERGFEVGREPDRLGLGRGRGGLAVIARAVGRVFLGLALRAVGLWRLGSLGRRGLDADGVLEEAPALLVGRDVGIAGDADGAVVAPREGEGEQALVGGRVDLGALLACVVEDAHAGDLLRAEPAERHGGHLDPARDGARRLRGDDARGEPRGDGRQQCDGDEQEGRDRDDDAADARPLAPLVCFFLGGVPRGPVARGCLVGGAVGLSVRAAFALAAGVPALVVFVPGHVGLPGLPAGG